jgi:hypothetical protein
MQLLLGLSVALANRLGKPRRQPAVDIDNTAGVGR